jgi:hypothetical protein
MRMWSDISLLKRGRRRSANYQFLGDRNGAELLHVGGLEIPCPVHFKSLATSHSSGNYRRRGLGRCCLPHNLQMSETRSQL